MRNTSARLTYSGTHGSNLIQLNYYNQAPQNYVWYMTQGVALPTGTLASVATRPYDNKVYGTIGRFQSTGLSNLQSLQFQVERRFSQGIAFQAFYVLSNALEIAKDGWRNNRAAGADILFNAGNYLPGAVPTDDTARNRLLYYARDPAIPQHKINYNWIVQLPLGIGRNSGRFLDAVIGGWQVAGNGTLRSTWWALPTANWGQGTLQLYGKQHPVDDCRSGVCYPGFLYYNGYIPANQINAHNSAGQCTGVCGVPSDYKPLQSPLIPIPANGGSASDPMFRYYDTNNVYVTLKNGSQVLVAYNTNLHPWRNQYVLGPIATMLNASAFKTVRLTEKAQVRFNADFFNVLNMPGTPMPGGDGLIQMRNSFNTPRQLQLTLRLTW
jgi:hypothetical protein